MSFSLRQILENSKTAHPTIDWGLIEQDYALTWMLIGMIHIPDLANNLIFKGGTCLKKCYFGEYRFSQDLDFSVIGPLPQGKLLECRLIEAAAYVTDTTKNLGYNLEFSVQRYTEKKPHPENQEAFTVAVHYPWQREPLTKIMVEITISEIVYLPAQSQALIHHYPDMPALTIKAYAIEEIISEKISALLGFNKKLHERGWGRSRARDYYDLWRIFYGDLPIQTDLISSLVEKKCARKGVIFRGYDDLFGEKLMRDLEKSWRMWVKPLVPILPDKQEVIEDLRHFLESIPPSPSSL